MSNLLPQLNSTGVITPTKQTKIWYIPKCYIRYPNFWVQLGVHVFALNGHIFELC